MREQELHVAATQYLDLALPAGAMHAAIDSRGKVSVIGGAALKARPSRRWFSYHVILHAGVARVIRIKAMKGQMTPQQLGAIQRLRAAGFEVWIVRSLTELELQLENARLSPARGTVH